MPPILARWLHVLGPALWPWTFFEAPIAARSWLKTIDYCFQLPASLLESVHRFKERRRLYPIELREKEIRAVLRVWQFEKRLRRHGLMMRNEEVYSVDDVTRMTGFSRHTVTRIFEREPGVIVLKRPEAMHKRSYRSIRIPRSVYERVVGRLTVR